MKSALLVLAKLIAITIFLGQQFHPIYCGVSSPKRNDDGTIKIQSRIVGGQLAKESEFRGIVSLRNNGNHFCGGTWVKVGNLSQVVTAAHCVMNGKKLRHSVKQIDVMGDDLSISADSPSQRRQILKVRKIVAHPSFKVIIKPDYKTPSIQNDVAIIFLEGSFKETNTFGPVELSNATLKDDQPCKTAGWGRIHWNGDLSTDLLIIEMSVVSRKTCNLPQSYSGAVFEHAFCAGSMNGDVDTCQGDSGGGVISNNELIGVVSFGNKCGLRNFPGVYTQVADYYDWIEKTMNKSSAMTQSYILMLTTIFVAIFLQITPLQT